MNTSPPGDELEEIKAALFRGCKIEAIKLFRQCFGTGVAEAKTGVEKLEAELRISSPEKFSTRPANKGCFTAIAALVLLLTCLVLLAQLARH